MGSLEMLYVGKNNREASSLLPPLSWKGKGLTKELAAISTCFNMNLHAKEKKSHQERGVQL